MKNLIALLLLVSLTGCVTYYYPEAALEDGVYYAEDDPAYVLNSGDYSGVVYYPWSSLDYFYLGYWPYPGYGFAPGYGSWLGYSPWNYSAGYFGYYPPRYFPRHGYAFRRHHYYRYTMNDLYHRHRANTDIDEQITRDGDVNDGTIHSSSVRQFVTTPPPGYAGYQGMVVRNRHDSKIGKSHLEPTKPTNARPVSVRRSTSNVFARPSRTPSHNSQRSRSHTARSPSRSPGYGKSRASSRRDRD